MSTTTAKTSVMGLPSDETLATLSALPDIAQANLQAMRALIFEVGEDDQIGGVEECLKWNQPSYQPRKAKVGTAIRLGYDEKNEQCLLYGHCQSTLIDQWRERYSDTFTFLGNRALMFSVHDEVPSEALAECIWLALTYHKRK